MVKYSPPPRGTSKGRVLYLTLYLKSSPNRGIISFLIIVMLIIPSKTSLTISPYTPLGVNCKIYPSHEVNAVEFYLNISYL